MTTTTVMETLQKRSFFPLRPHKEDLPISQPPPSHGGDLRRRLSAISIRLPSPGATSSYSWPFRRSKSTSCIPDSDRCSSSPWRWWGLGISWLLSFKPSFAHDLAMDDEEAAVLGSHSRGTWRHLLYKVRRLVRSPTMPNEANSSYTFK